MLRFEFKVELRQTICGYINAWIQNALKRLLYQPHKNPQVCQHDDIPIHCITIGKQQKYPRRDTSPLPSAAETNYIQSVVGSLLYYGRALDNSLLHALNEIGGTQSHSTIKTK